jgi:hypothetical protein
MQLICVDPARVSEFWPYARDLIRAAIEHTKLSDFASIETDVLSGDQLLWLAFDGKSILAAATTHLTKPNNKVCTLTACAGSDRRRWLPLLGKIEQYAKDEGCVTLRIFGRIGWKRVLKNYKMTHIILENDLQ